MVEKMDLADMGKGIVYLKTIAVADLPKKLQEHAEGRDEIVSVHNHEGEQLALVVDEKLAIDLARQHEMTPVVLH